MTKRQALDAEWTATLEDLDDEPAERWLELVTMAMMRHYLKLVELESA